MDIVLVDGGPATGERARHSMGSASAPAWTRILLQKRVATHVPSLRFRVVCDRSASVVQPHPYLEHPAMPDLIVPPRFRVPAPLAILE